MFTSRTRSALMLMKRLIFTSKHPPKITFCAFVYQYLIDSEQWAMKWLMTRFCQGIEGKWIDKLLSMSRRKQSKSTWARKLMNGKMRLIERWKIRVTSILFWFDFENSDNFFLCVFFLFSQLLITLNDVANLRHFSLQCTIDIRIFDRNVVFCFSYHGTRSVGL